MRALMLTLALAAATALGGCGSQTDTATPADATNTVSPPAGSDLPCPARPGDPPEDSYGPDAGAVAEFLPVAGMVCRFDMATEDSGVVAQAELTAEEAAGLWDRLRAGEPLGPDRVCTQEIGPAWLVRLADATGAVVDVRVNGYGCREVDVVDDQDGGFGAGDFAKRAAAPDVVEQLREMTA